MEKESKKIKYGKRLCFGNYVISMSRRSVIDDMEKVKVRELDYFLVQSVDEHLRIEIPETAPSFQYIKHLLETNDDCAVYIELMLSNMLFVANSTDCFFHNALKLLEIVVYDPLLLKEGHSNGKLSHEDFIGMVKRISDKWIDAYEMEMKNFSKKSDEYTEQDAREDAAADAAEQELRRE